MSLSITQTKRSKNSRKREKIRINNDVNKTILECTIEITLPTITVCLTLNVYLGSIKNKNNSITPSHYSVHCNEKTKSRQIQNQALLIV